MSKEYLVWIELEEYDSETDEHTPVEGWLDFSSTGRFESLVEAILFAKKLDDRGRLLKGVE